MHPLTDAATALLDWRGDERSATGNFFFAAHLPIFAGHFPADPVLPGVYQVAAMLVLARQAWAMPTLRLSAVTRAKWLLPVAPDRSLTVHLTRLNDCHFSGFITLADQRCATCQFSCADS